MPTFLTRREGGSSLAPVVVANHHKLLDHKPPGMSPVDKLLHGDENVICADDGYRRRKAPEHADRSDPQVAARRSTYKMLDKRSALYKAKRKIERPRRKCGRRSSTRFE